MKKMNKKGQSHAKRGLSHAKRGFTLIELLIVIVIIGILAVLVLSTINPIEQRNKATDTALRSTSAELLNGVERYYASNGVYPWDEPDVTDAPTSGFAVNNNSGWFDKLVSTAEVKPEFQDREDFSQLIYFYDTDTDLVRICFEPKSKTFQKNNMKFNETGAPLSSNGGTPKYVCVPE